MNSYVESYVNDTKEYLSELMFMEAYEEWITTYNVEINQSVVDSFTIKGETVTE